MADDTSTLTSRRIVVDDGPALPPLAVKGAYLVRFPEVAEPRGTLIVGELGAQLPFAAQRFFTIASVPPGHRRGEHAHRELEEVVVCLRGECTILLDDGRHREDVVLSSPTVGLYIPPLVWRVHHGHSADALLLALASTTYEPDDYIRSYDDFLRAVGGQ